MSLSHDIRCHLCVSHAVRSLAPSILISPDSPQVGSSQHHLGFCWSLIAAAIVLHSGLASPVWRSVFLQGAATFCASWLWKQKKSQSRSPADYTWWSVNNIAYSHPWHLMANFPLLINSKIDHPQVVVNVTWLMPTRNTLCIEVTPGGKGKWIFI